MAMQMEPSDSIVDLSAAPAETEEEKTAGFRFESQQRDTDSALRI